MTMKQLSGIFLFLLFLILPCNLFPQNGWSNYLRSVTMLDASGDDSIVSVQYYDDVGRPYLQVQGGKNTTGKYLYTLQTYDDRGRDCEQWLPVTGKEVPEFLYEYEVQRLSRSIYADSMAYNVTDHDAVGRIISVQQAGEDWHNAGKKISRSYITNTANSIKLYEAPIEGTSLIQTGYYEAGTLYGEETVDEDGHRSVVYKDRNEKVVLERRDGDNDTYYVYNTLGQLRFVLSPKYQESGKKAEYGYEYRYDSKNRLVKKILPGCEYVQYWYDKADNLTFMQDATLRTQGLYRFFCYDKFGRLCIQGTCTDCNRGDYVNTVTYSISEAGIANTGYAAKRYDLYTSPQIEIVYYYGQYHYLQRHANLFQPLASHLPTEDDTNTTGLETGRLLAASDGSFLLDATYYNDLGQVIDSRRITADGYYLSSQTEYTFTGKVSKKTDTQYHHDGTTLKTAISASLQNGYDEATGLLLHTDLTIQAEGGNPVTKRIRHIEYDDLGRISCDTRNGSAGSIEYEYNLRGWVTGITGKGFKETLHYTDGRGTPYYNGNISSQLWMTDNDGRYRGYKFTYDGMNRLTQALYGEHQTIDTNPNRYTETVLEYDPNGGIERFQRHGLKQNGVYGKIDNLNIKLEGNRLKSVTDDAEPIYYTGASDFRDGADKSTEYTYNGNGALVSDANKGIAHIEYDNLNHPREIQFINGHTTRYVYAADGTKLRTTHVTAVENVTVPMNSAIELTDAQILSKDSIIYLQDALYENGALKRYGFDCGFVTFKTDNSPFFHYYTKDHLGNNRVVVDENGTLEQVTHYYAFGGIYGDLGLNPSFQKFKYNGKELDRMHGLDWYDFGARSYDAAGVPMFTSVDPLCEKSYHVSPYVYCENNPLVRIDKNGEAWETVWDLFNVGLGIQSFTENIQGGNYWDAAVDAGGILIDAAAAIVPAVPGGVGAGIKAARGGTLEKEFIKFAGKSDTNNSTAREAFRKAKDQNGIPRSQQPDKTMKPNTLEGENAGLTNKNVKLYQFTNSKGEKINIRQDKAVKYDKDGGSQSKHFNAGLEDEKLKQHHNYEDWDY